MQEQAVRGIARELLDLVRGIGGHRVDAVNLVPALEEGQRERRAEPSARADDGDGLADRLARLGGTKAVDVERMRGVSREALDRQCDAVERAVDRDAAGALVDVADAQPGSALAGGRRPSPSETPPRRLWSPGISIPTT